MPTPAPNRSLQHTLARANPIARGRVITHARRIKEALHKADKLWGPAYLEKKQGLYSKLVELATEWKQATLKSYEGNALRDEQLADMLIEVARGWVASANVSGIKAKKSDRKRLEQGIVEYLGEYLGIVIAEGGEVEETDDTTELKQQLQTHVTFVMKQLEYETIGPAFMEKRWNAYSKLREMEEELHGKTNDAALEDTMATLMRYAAQWAELKSDEGSTRKGKRGHLRREVILVLSGIKV